MNDGLELLRGFFDQYGYWTVFVALLLENAGVPVPGETVLLFASFLAFDEQELRLRYIILVGIAAATLGDKKRAGAQLKEILLRGIAKPVVHRLNANAFARLTGGWLKARTKHARR